MGVVLWKHKGCELSPQELDGNFEDLSARLGLLEILEASGQGIREITLEGDELIFHGWAEALLGRVRLPVPRLHFKGAWCEGQDYTYADVVRKGAALYFCHRAHLGQSHFDKEFWTLMLGEDDACHASSSQDLAVSAHGEAAPLQVATHDAAHMPTPQIGGLVVSLGADGATLMLGTRGGWHKITSVPL